ncbi:hypothetical protein UYO_2141 [Lachnospiraceae bacterium JC7]|nr:hypothetical protein UYO_2141 [Lachnospiraceae bacterium JC7]
MINIHTLLILILYLSVFALFYECWIVFRNLKNRLHAYLLFSCVSGLINSLGYVLQFSSTNFEAFRTALKFSYAGRVWLSFSLFMFTAEFCHIRLPELVKKVLPVIHVGIYITILTMEYNSLYYENIGFSMDGQYPVFYRDNGIAHHLLMQLQVFYIVCAFIWLFRSLKKHTGIVARWRHWTVITAIFIQASFYIAQIAGVFSVSRYFDLTIMGNVILTAFMYIAIFRCNLLGVIDIARDYMIDKLSEGVIAVDNDGKVQYYNEPALRLFPVLKEDAQKAVDEIKDAIDHGDTINLHDRIYVPEDNELSGGGEILGKLYSMVDSTELKKNEYRLKADAEILQMAASTMKDRLLTTEELMKQDRAMRHDRRHFESLILSLLQEGNADEAIKCLNERLSQEPHSMIKYCENTTVNAAITHYVSVAERENIRVEVKTNIPSDPGVDDMKLAIAVSNLIENAIHACEKLPEQDRFIGITARYKEQLLLEIVNACEKKAELDEDGHPYTDEDGHGIGTRSVLAFVEETDSEIMYVAGEKRFKVRMIIG